MNTKTRLVYAGLHLIHKGCAIQKVACGLSLRAAFNSDVGGLGKSIQEFHGREEASNLFVSLCVLAPLSRRREGYNSAMSLSTAKWSKCTEDSDWGLLETATQQPPLRTWPKLDLVLLLSSGLPGWITIPWEMLRLSIRKAISVVASQPFFRGFPVPLKWQCSSKRRSPVTVGTAAMVVLLKEDFHTYHNTVARAWWMELTELGHSLKSLSAIFVVRLPSNPF